MTLTEGRTLLQYMEWMMALTFTEGLQSDNLPDPKAKRQFCLIIIFDKIKEMEKFTLSQPSFLKVAKVHR